MYGLCYVEICCYLIEKFGFFSGIGLFFLKMYVIVVVM